MGWLTFGLLLFAAAQVGLQYRTEQQRQKERRADRDEAEDRAFQVVWAEHFRLEGLANELDRRDLIEMALLEVLSPEDVLPRHYGELAEAMGSLGVEAGFLGGVGYGLCHDVARSIALLTSSVRSFASHGPTELTPSRRVSWLRAQYGPDLEPWEVAVRKGVRELAMLMWDAARHSSRADVAREMNFADDISSEFAAATVAALRKREASRRGLGGAT